MAQATTEAAVDLGRYRGKKITRVSGKVTNTGDGLSAAHELDPVVYDPGTLVSVVIRARVVDHDYAIIGDTNEVELKQGFKASTIIIVDNDLVTEMLDRQEARMEERRAAQAGQGTLPGQDAATGRRGSLRVVKDGPPAEKED